MQILHTQLHSGTALPSLCAGTVHIMHTS
jgi:hypothetical protein